MAFIMAIKQLPLKFRDMHNPPHPGKVIRELHLEPLNISVTRAADLLGVSRKTLSKVVNGNGAVTAEMAIRLSQLFSTTPELWLNHQANYDLWQAEQELDINVKPIALVSSK